MNERLKDIDTAKGIGIILVVVGHHLLGADYVKKWLFPRPCLKNKYCTKRKKGLS